MVTSLRASSPSPATATPSSSGVVGELVLRAGTCWPFDTTVWGGERTNGVFATTSARMEGGKLSILGVGRGEWRTLRPTSGVAGPHRLRRTLGQEPSNRNSRTRTLEQELSFSLSQHRPGTLLVRPFVAQCSAPSLRPVLFSTSLRGVSRKLSKGGVPPP